MRHGSINRDHCVELRDGGGSVDKILKLSADCAHLAEIFKTLQ